MALRNGKRMAQSATLNDIEIQRIFEDPVETAKESRVFMSRLLYCSFSLLLRCRGVLPPEAFKKGIIDGSVKSYVMDLKNPVGLRVADKLRGACLALEDGYLERLVLLLTEDGSDTSKALEAISWKVSYAPNGVTSMALTRAEKDFCRLEYTGQETVKEKTIAFLRLIQMICAELHPVPDNTYASLRSVYTSDAPLGYQADGFYDCPELYKMNPDANRHCVPGVITKQNRCWLLVDSVYLDSRSRSQSVFSHADRRSISSHNTPAVKTGYTLEKNNFENVDVEEMRSVGPATRSRKRTTLTTTIDDFILDDRHSELHGEISIIDMEEAQTDSPPTDTTMENDVSIENNTSMSAPDAELVTSPTNPYSQSMERSSRDSQRRTPGRARFASSPVAEDGIEVKEPSPKRQSLRTDEKNGRERTPGRAYFLNGA